MTAVASEVMWSVSRIAEREGISRQAISKQVARMIEHHGLDVSHDGRGRVSAVNIVNFDTIRRRFGDSGKVHEAPAPKPTLPDPEQGSGDATLDGARRLKVIYETESIRLRLGEESGQLVRMDVMTEALTRMAEEIGRVVDLPQHADAIAAASGRGLHELRITLKRLTVEMRGAIADHCARVALAAPQKDDGLTPEGSNA